MYEGPYLKEIASKIFEMALYVEERYNVPVSIFESTKVMDSNIPQLRWRPPRLIKLPSSSNGMYSTIYIPKSNGKKRRIDAPDETLKDVQKEIQKLILYNHSPSDVAMAYVKGKNVVLNASMHLGKENILQIDIKDFFPSITPFQVMLAYVRVLVEISEREELEESGVISFDLRRIVDRNIDTTLRNVEISVSILDIAFQATILSVYGNEDTGGINPLTLFDVDTNMYVYRKYREGHKSWTLRPFYTTSHKITNKRAKKLGFLPQGAPTSPTLSNIILEGIDAKGYAFMTQVLHLEDAMYTRYCDNITISWNTSELQPLFEEDHSKYLGKIEFWNQAQAIRNVVGFPLHIYPSRWGYDHLKSPEKFALALKKVKNKKTRIRPTGGLPPKTVKKMILAEFTKSLKAMGFKLNTKKTKLSTNNQRKVITGVSINPGYPNIPRSKYRIFRARMHNIAMKPTISNHDYLEAKGIRNWIAQVNPMKLPYFDKKMAIIEGKWSMQDKG